MAPDMSGGNSRNDVQQKLDSAYACQAKGEFEEALQLCDEIIEATPDFADIYNLKGVIYEQLGRKQEAVELYGIAIKLDSDFKEAKENLTELVAELELEKEKEVHKQDAFYVAKWGALAFGLAFGIISIIKEFTFLMDFPQYGGIYELGSNWIRSYSPDVFVGLATAVLGYVSHKKPLAFGLAGGVGYEVARLFGWGVLVHGISLLLSSSNILSLNFVSTFVSFAIGAIYGAIVGVVTRDKRQILWLALAGAIGFGLYGSTMLFFGSYSYQNALIDGYGSFESQIVGYVVLNSIPRVLVDVILGVILGALFGSVLGWFSGEEIGDEEDDVVIK